MKTDNEYGWNILTIGRLLAAVVFVILGIVTATIGSIVLGSIVAAIALLFALYEWRRVRRNHLSL